jgi:hypothetical protein
MRYLRPLLDYDEADCVSAPRTPRGQATKETKDAVKRRQAIRYAYRLGDILALASPGMVTYRMLPFTFEVARATVVCLRQTFGAEVFLFKYQGKNLGWYMLPEQAEAWRAMREKRPADLATAGQVQGGNETAVQQPMPGTTYSSSS